MIIKNGQIMKVFIGLVMETTQPVSDKSDIYSIEIDILISYMQKY